MRQVWEGKLAAEEKKDQSNEIAKSLETAPEPQLL